MKKKIMIVCTTDSMIYNFLIPHIKDFQHDGYEVICACSRTGDFFDILVNEYGIKVEQIDFKRSPYDLKNIKAFCQLNKIIKKYKINIVFCHEPVGGVMGRLAGRLNKCKVVYMAHGFHFYKGAPKSSIIYYIVERFFSIFTNVLITINKEDYRASKSFFSKKKIKTNGIGIDTGKFTYYPDSTYLRKELNLSEDTVIVLSVGELIERKNHKTVIESMKYLPNNYHYVIVGDGELMGKYKKMVKAFHLSNRVHLLGYRRDISKICNSSDIFAMPSYQEGVSVALMEAMSCGLPVVASKIRGNTDLIDNGKGGFLVGTEDSKGYAIAISKIISNDMKEKFGNYNRKKVLEFDISTVRNQMKKIFEEI